MYVIQMADLPCAKCSGDVCEQLTKKIGSNHNVPQSVKLSLKVAMKFYVFIHRVRKKFFPLIESGLFNFDDPEQRELLRSALMTTCDIASICKPWEVQRKVADLVVSEFFEQGDKVRYRI